jgi:phospholipid-binding lipoprotein MlaA
LIDIRYRLLAADALLEESADPYITLRESVRQNRRYLIWDGNPPEDEDFYDDFEDFEDFDDAEEEQ